MIKDTYTCTNGVVSKANGYRLFKNFCHLNHRKNFSQWVINNPQEITESENVWTFKFKINQQYRFLIRHQSYHIINKI